MQLTKIQREIFLNNAKMRGEGMKKKKAKKHMKGGVTIGGMKKKKTTKKRVGGKKALPAGAQNWLNLVKKVYASGNMSWKDALKAASKIYRKM